MIHILFAKTVQCGKNITMSNTIELLTKVKEMEIMQQMKKAEIINIYIQH